MVSLQINDTTFEARVMQARKDLGDIVQRCENSLREKLRKNVLGTQGVDLSLLDVFLGSYFSIEARLSKSNYFEKENGTATSVVRNYSLYSASNAILNNLFDESIDELLRKGKRTAPLCMEDVLKDSSYHIVKSLISKLKLCIDTSDPTLLKYSLFNFFDFVKEFAKIELKTICNEHTYNHVLPSIKINKTGLKFTEIPIYQPKEKKAGKTGKKTSEINHDEGLPKTFKLYPLNENARLSRVVGNTEPTRRILNSLFMLLCYDNSCGKNAFAEDGRTFTDMFLAYGLPGTGKNFTIDAILNQARYWSWKHKKQLTIVDLSQIKSKFKDRSAQYVEHYLRMERNSPGVYVNILDEFDSVITNAEDDKTGETKKLIGAFKRAFGDGKGKGKILTIALTNYTSDKEIEPAIKQRFQGGMYRFDGPQTAKEFAEVLKNEMTSLRGDKLYISDVDFDELGALMKAYKDQFDQQNKFNGDESPERKNDKTNVYVTGRSCNLICTSLKEPPTVFEDERLLGFTYEQLKSVIKEKYPLISQKSIESTIYSFFSERKKECGYNGI